jgi:hypothetical protein
VTQPSKVTRTFQQTLQHYKELRALANELTEREFRALGVQLADIQLHDALAADKWVWSDPEKTPIWTWERMFGAYRSSRGAKRFDVAIKSGGVLRGLCYGIPSRRRLVLKLHALSRAPHANPLQGHVFRIALFAASTYGSFLGSQELWLVHPQTEGVARYYAKFGFQFHRDREGRTTHTTTKL